jgi:methionine synthase I (cobalamin-dependent)/5,10-methylenetetrahydrofolate reductase
VSGSSSLRDLVEDRRIHVLDGAMGTLLYSRGVFVNVCYDALALEDPDIVRRIHEEYVRAGAELLETNTFGANPVKLSAYGLEEQTAQINRVAAALALQAARGRALVVGSIGPLGIRIEPWGPTAVSEAEAHFAPQVEGLLEGGVHGFVLETFADPSELAAAYRAIRARTDLPVIAQMTVGEDGQTAYGTAADALARELDELGADVIGLNCSVGPAAMLDAVEAMAESTRRPLSAQPNAGLPRTVRDRKMYMASPEYMARYSRRLIEAGVRFIGGCCGTTPEHIKQLAATVASLQPKHATVPVRATVRADEEAPAEAEPFPLAERSALGAKLARGEFVTTVELLPPRGWELDELLSAARAARSAGADAVNVVDSPGGRTRMAAIPAGMIVQREAGIEPIVHYSCRDRNMLGMLSDLLGAAAGGIRNVLLISGDPPVQGPYPDATAVFDIDSIGLTNVVVGLNRGLDPGGSSLAGGPTRFVVGVAVNPAAPDLEREIERFLWKVDAGADFAVTQPLFDGEALERFFGRAGWRIPVFAGIWPLTSLRNAEFLANEVPGVQVPASVIERMKRAQARGAAAAREEGVALAREGLEAVRARVQGVHLSAPGGEVEAALAVLDGVTAAGPTRDHGAI